MCEQTRKPVDEAGGPFDCPPTSSICEREAFLSSTWAEFSHGLHVPMSRSTGKLIVATNDVRTHNMTT